MQELELMIKKKWEEKIASGDIETLVEKSINKLLEDAIGDMFKSYGGIGKQIKETLEKGFAFDESEIDFAHHRNIINAQLSLELNRIVSEEFGGKIIERIQSVMKPLPDVMTPVEFLEKIAEGLREEHSWDNDVLDYLHIEVEENYTVKGHDLKVFVRKQEGRYGSSQPAINLHFSEEGSLRGRHGVDHSPYYCFHADAFILKAYSQGVLVPGWADFDPDHHEFPLRNEDECRCD